MIEGSCKAYNRELDPMIKKIFTEYRKTHNQGCLLYTSINIMYQQLTLTSDATINQNDSQGPKKNADNVPTFW